MYAVPTYNFNSMCSVVSLIQDLGIRLHNVMMVIHMTVSAPDVQIIEKNIHFN